MILVLTFLTEVCGFDGFPCRLALLSRLWVGAPRHGRAVLAGQDRTNDLGAERSVHSLRDERGREAGDLAPQAPAYLTHIGYCKMIGPSDERGGPSTR